MDLKRRTERQAIAQGKRFLRDEGLDPKAWNLEVGEHPNFGFRFWFRHRQLPLWINPCYNQLEHLFGSWAEVSMKLGESQLEMIERANVGKMKPAVKKLIQRLDELRIRIHLMDLKSARP